MTDPSAQPIHVIKLGGSLLDLPDLPRRWSAFAQSCMVGQPLLIVGGGHPADTVRAFDQRFDFDETEGHWLAVHAMQFNGRLVAATLPNARWVTSIKQANEAWADDCTAVIDPVAWLKACENSGDGVPHRWVFTSDSIAAHAAAQLSAIQLTLLKSTLPPNTCDVAQAAELGIVDEAFPETSRDVSAINLINLRHAEPASADAHCVLR